MPKILPTRNRLYFSTTTIFFCKSIIFAYMLPILQALEAHSDRIAIPYTTGHLVFRIWGQGEPVVLLHGGSGSWKHWVKNITALVQDGRQVLVPDMPGFGESAAPLVGQDADVLAEPIAWAIQQIIPNRAFDLVAFSFGSMVAAQLAVSNTPNTTNPTNVRKLILTGSPALGINELRPFKLKPWNDLPEGPARDAIHRHNLGVLMFSSPHAVDELALEIHRANLALDRMKRRRLAYTDFLLQLLRKVPCPVFGIWGALDVLYKENHAAVEKAMEQSPNFQRLEFIEHAGHWVQFEYPDAYNAALISALA
jgi:2-hydroxy-6-oxonona-2,4-dienedioate hydrolase